MFDKAASISRRGIIKGQLTRIGNFVQNFSIGEGDINQLRIRKEKAKECWEEFQKIQQELERHSTDALTEESYRIEFEDMYFEIAAEYEAKLTKEEINLKMSQNSTNVSLRSSTSNQASIVKLAALNVPQYSGDYKEWATFHDMFMALIHSNDALTDVQRFFYLKSALTGEAAKMIQSFETSAKNYLTAWECLKERYNNKRILVKNHTKAIFDLKSIDQESSAKLRYFIDSLQGHRKALEALGYETENWGPLLVHVILIKLDAATLREWETQAHKTEVSKVNELIEFLQKRFQILEAVEGVQKLNTKIEQKTHQQYQPSSKAKKYDGAAGFQKTAIMHATATKFKCYACDEGHPIYRCAKFLSLSIPERNIKVEQLKICTVCLSKHAENKCKFKGCRKCGEKHNTLLHTPADDNDDSPAVTQSINAHAANKIKQTHVLLSTAIINIRSQSNDIFCARALLDSGSQSNFITNELANKLQLSRKKVNFAITGIDGSTNRAYFAVKTAVQSRTTSYKETLQFLILPKITPNLPTTKIKYAVSDIPNFVQLADPSYNEPGKIDILIGAERFFEMLKSGKYKPNENGPVFQETELGWVVAGPVAGDATTNVHSFVAQTEENENFDTLQRQLAKFWNLEEVVATNQYDREEKMCVEHFESTVKRGWDGKFIVQLPLTKNVDKLGESRTIAKKRFFALENRLRKDTKLYEGYKEFINDYLQLGHMEITPKMQCIGEKSYFMPHHAVCRDNSITTKIRVVFDASCETNTGLSLNDVLLKGPVIQDDLVCIVSRFRIHKFVLSADIKQMYRQIWVSEKDKNLQQILWRFKPDDEIQEYHLKTVTYGTKPASYIATGCLKQLSDEYKIQYPIASEVIASDFYMDDLLCGTSSLSEAITLRDNLITILDSAGLQLRKWVSNIPQVLNNIPNVDNDPLRVLNLDSSPIKTLGLFWNPHDDIYQYKVNDPLQRPTTATLTKRNILSSIATIFDPLGLIGPIVITAKIIMQKLWQKGINWDEQLPPSICKEWEGYCRELIKIEKIIIPRRIICCDEYVSIQIHGFADASTVAYGACLYVRTTDRTGKHCTRLIVAKSRVAPLKTISLARLELCAAVLLVRISQKIVPKLRLQIAREYYWSDSTIVLAWINAPSSRWKTFVAHRVGEIHEVTTASQWRHVKSENNPADIISRGCTPDKLQNEILWWEGPPWINNNENEWPKNSIDIKITENETMHEKKKNVTVVTVSVEEMSIIEKYSSLPKLLRVVSKVMRWKRCAIDKKRITTKTTELDEYNDAKQRLIKVVQQQYFSNEINCLKKMQNVSDKSKLRFWRPFLDTNNVLRVGGRLNKAESMGNETRNPIILPSKSSLTKLIFEYEHRRLLHAGPQALLAGIREQYWPLDGRNIARKTVHACVQCFRTKPITCQPICGDLPKDRVEPRRPFEVCGVDYAGPILVKTSLRRNAQATKGYICVFICFVTKAVHLELVGDLSTNAFLAALRRFWSRRGMSKSIYSDNGTNFVGANRQLQELRDLFASEQHNQQVQEFSTEIGVKWHFIPPRAPHFGGLWEAAVKSVKGHLRKTLGNAMLTYEELYTVLVRIEACLNSRPITPLSSDPADLNALTPGHFLVGSSLNCLPEADISTMSPNRLRRWQRTVQLTQQIWHRWRTEYLSQLQCRQNWIKSKGIDLKEGSMVLIKEDNLPPLQWRLGRVTQLIPGDDGVTRVAIVKTERGEIKRAVRTLCPLPINND